VSGEKRSKRSTLTSPDVCHVFDKRILLLFAELPGGPEMILVESYTDLGKQLRRNKKRREARKLPAVSS
jgi:hypothetical protein